MSKKRKVLLIGWDSADWRVISPLVDQGLMPALSRVIEGGTMGNLGSIEPILSPIIWTSIATGKLPHKHGVLGFAEPDPLGGGIRPVGSETRTAKALWNILSEAGLSTHVVGWYASHPAEPINGICVSERFHLAPSLDAKNWAMPTGAVMPADVAADLQQFRVHPTEITGTQLLPFIPRAAELDQRNPVVARRLTALAKILAETASVQAAATWIMENREWDFLGVYFRALDELAHHFMPFHPPRLSGVSEEDVALYGQVMRAGCQFHDLMLARLLQLAGPDTTVLIVSDHGFESGRHRPGAVANELDTMAQWHRPFGIFAAAGEGIAKDERIYGSSVLDIAPTVLYLFGLPVGRDMDGKVLVNALSAPGDIERVESWETAGGAGDAEGAEAQNSSLGRIEEEKAVFEQLAALGYMEAPDENAERLMRKTSNELSFNRVISLQFAELHAQAAAEAQRMVLENPDERRFRLKLVQVLLQSGKSGEARDELEALEARLGPCPHSQRMFATLLGLEGRLDEALARFEEAERAAPQSPAIQEQLGHLLLRKRSWRAAEKRFRSALKLEPDTPTAHVGLARALARQNKDTEAIKAALTALGLQYHLPAGHFQLGAILSKLHFPQRAILSFETGLSMQPDNALAHRYLCRLYRRAGMAAKADLHERRYLQLDPCAKAES